MQEPEVFPILRKEKDFAKDFFARVIDSMKQVPEAHSEMKASLISEITPMRMMPQQAIITKLALPEPKISQPTQIFYSKLQGINFGKITPLILDPKIKSIVCDGANKPIKIKEFLNPAPSETNIMLSEQEIKQVINLFSERSSTPVVNIFRARIENVGIEAIVSDMIGSRFIITK